MNPIPNKIIQSWTSLNQPIGYCIRALIFFILSIVLTFIFPLDFSLAKPAQRAAQQGDSDSSAPRITYDLGFSSGSFNNISYSEFNFGLNLNFYPWLAWRNAVFSRFVSGAKTLYGLDSSVRWIFEAGSNAFGFTSFAGPGIRFINEGTNALFAEAGLVLHLVGLHVGAGVKQLFNSISKNGEPNDTVYFIVVGGGGSL